MSPTPAALLRVVDPVDLGRRIRAARLDAGLKQADLAGSDVSAAYVSRIEDGKRRPDLKVLRAFARRLGTPVEVLLTGLTEAQRAELRARLDFAELSLSSEDAAAALVAADALLADLVGTTDPELWVGVQRLRAAALEGRGDLAAAVVVLRELVAQERAEVGWVRDLMSLSRCLRESGRLDEAIAVGEGAAGRVEALGLGGLTEAVQLTITTAAGYIFRGDLGHGLRLCKRAAADAERLGLPVARASALWNASLALQIGGDGDAALALALEALVGFEEAGDTRNLGRLRIHVANVQLTMGVPDPASAVEMLERARNEIDWSSASALDAARHRLGLGIAFEQLGRLEEAEGALAESVALAPDAARELEASQAALRGRLAAARGDLHEARDEFQRAVSVLTSVGADTDAAQTWLELGEVFTSLGEDELAADAFMRAGASQGLRPNL